MRNTGTNDPISVITIFASIFYLFGLLIVANIRYSKFIRTIRKTQPNFSEDLDGLYVGDGGKFLLGNGEYWFRTPLPINAKTNDLETLIAIKRHDKIIKIFWISVLTIIPGVIIFLNIRGK